MVATHRNRLVTAISNTPGSTGALTIAAAASGYRTFGAADDGLSFDVSIVDGTAWEIRTGCVYTHAGTSLARGTLEDSSTGTAINLTSAAAVTVTMTAAMGNSLVVQINRPGVTIRNTATTSQTVAALTLAKITTCLNSVVRDTNGWWNTSTKTFAPTVAGIYDVNAALNWDVMGASKVGELLIAKNQSTSPEYFGGQYMTNSTAQILGITASTVISMNGTTDILEFFTYNSDSVGRTTRSDSAGRVLFSAIFLGAA